MQKVAVEFCTEVAVLLAVFPLLDSIIGGSAATTNRVQGVALEQDWMHNVSWPLVRDAWGLAAIFLLFAVIITVAGGENQ